MATGAASVVLAAAVVWLYAPLLFGDSVIAGRDALSYFLPMHARVAAALRQAEMPWWNPAPVLGKPFFAEWHAGLFYPPTWLLAALPFPRAEALLVCAHHVLAGLGALLWLRGPRLRLPVSAALFGALAFTLGGALVSLDDLTNHLESAAWLPWVLWGWDRGRNVASRIAGAAFFLALSLLGGSPEMAGIAILALVVVSRDPWAMTVVPLAAGIAAAQLLPFALYFRETARATSGLSPAAVLTYSATPTRLAGFVIAGAGAADGRAFLTSVYLGPVVMVFAAVGLTTLSRRHAVGLLAVVGILVTLALGRNTPVLPWLLDRAPAMAALRYPEKLLVAIHAVLAALAAVGVGQLLRARWLCDGGGGRIVVRALLGVALLGSATLGWVAAHRDLQFSLPVPLLLGPPRAARGILDDAARSTTEAEESAAETPIETAGGSRPPLRYWANLGGGPVTHGDAAEAMADRAILFAAVGEFFGLANVNTPGGLNLASHDDLARTLGQVPRDRALRHLAVLGTRYVTSWRSLEGAPEVEPMELTGIADSTLPVQLYRIRDPGPRALVARRVAEAEDRPAALRAWFTADLADVAGLAVVESRPTSDAEAATAVAATATATAASDSGRVRSVRDLSGSRVEIEVDMERTGLVVLQDTWAPGWHAEVDGEPTAVLRVNGLVRGVAAPAGAHRIVLTYSPPGLLAGAVVSIVGLLVLALLVGAGATSPVVPPAGERRGPALATRPRAVHDTVGADLSPNADVPDAG